MAAHDRIQQPGRRRPSRLATQLTDAFAPFAEWSEVKVVRNEFGRRDRIVAPIRSQSADLAPFDWKAAA